MGWRLRKTGQFGWSHWTVTDRLRANTWRAWRSIVPPRSEDHDHERWPPVARWSAAGPAHYQPRARHTELQSSRQRRAAARRKRRFSQESSGQTFLEASLQKTPDSHWAGRATTTIDVRTIWATRFVHARVDNSAKCRRSKRTRKQTRFGIRHS